jgi:hypothetical protein
VLLVSLCITFVIGLTLASYLVLVQNLNKSVNRSQVWNGAMVVAEAGVEDAFGLLNRYVDVQTVGNWVTTYSSDGWTVSGNVYSLTRYMDAAHTMYYTVNITNTGFAPVICSSGYVKGPLDTTLSRTVVIQTKIDALFNVCMASLGAIDLKGNGIATDSFDSTSLIYSANGYYDPLRRKDGGDVVTNDAITNSIVSVGNASIAGHVTTGPSGLVTIGPNGSVGDLAWVAATLGIKPGWSGNDLNVAFKDIAPPDTSWSPSNGNGMGGASGAPIISPKPGSPAYSQNYDHVYTKAGDYAVNDSGTIYVGTNVAVRLHITVGTFNPNQIYVAGVGATAGKMLAYVESPSVSLGTDDMTQSGVAKNMAFFGTTNCTSLSYKGNGDFTGVIYVPDAAFQLAGGGSGIIDFIGASVSRTVQMNGHYHFHYDESLKNSEWNNGYVAARWQEF